MEKNSSFEKPLYSRDIPKMSSDGKKQVGSMNVSVKVFEGHKFIQLTQKKNSFGFPNTEGYKPEKQSWVTINPDDKALKEALQEAYKV